MYIELTDHLRCPAEHEEQFLVLLPHRMEGRSVRSGDLGCPVCGRVVRVEQGVADFGGGIPSGADTSLTGEAVAVLLGLTGPGGYVTLVGSATRVGDAVAGCLPGVRLVLVNPPPDTPDAEAASVLRGATLPLKSSSMRGVVLGRDLGGEPAWIDAAIRAVLPGLRVVGEGIAPAREGLEVLAQAGGVWVAQKPPPLISY